MLNILNTPDLTLIFIYNHSVFMIIITQLSLKG
jgi:hypothetical protein